MAAFELTGIEESVLILLVKQEREASGIAIYTHVRSRPRYRSERWQSYH